METLLHKAHSIGSAMYNGRTRTTTMSTKNHDDIVALPLKSETWPMCAVCLCAYRIVSYRIGSGLCCERAFLPSNATSIKWFITAFFGRSENCYRSFLLTTHTFIFIPWYRCCAMPLCYEMLWLCSSLAKKNLVCTDDENRSCFCGWSFGILAVAFVCVGCATRSARR